MNYEEVKLHPAQYFHRPSDVVNADDLSWTQKIDVLEQWKDEANQEREAVAEGMPGDDSSDLLHEIGELLTQISQERQC